MKPLLRHARSNVIAYLALFIAIGGTSYAAVSLPANSVGTRQLRNHAVTPIKLDRKTIGGYVRAWAVIGPNGHLVSGAPGTTRLVAWDPTFAGGTLEWRTLRANCFALATGNDGFVWASVVPGRPNHATVHFEARSTSGQPDPSERVAIAVLCPTP